MGNLSENDQKNEKCCDNLRKTTKKSFSEHRISTGTQFQLF